MQSYVRCQPLSKFAGISPKRCSGRPRGSGSEHNPHGRGCIDSAGPPLSELSHQSCPFQEGYLSIFGNILTDHMYMFPSALSGHNNFPTTKLPTYNWSKH